MYLRRGAERGGDDDYQLSVFERFIMVKRPHAAVDSESSKGGQS